MINNFNALKGGSEDGLNNLKIFQIGYLFLLLFLLISLTSHASIFKDTLNNNKNSSILNLKINVDIQDKSLKSVLEELSNSYNIGFLYIEEQIPLELKINNIKGEFPLHKFLDLILGHSNLSYFILDDQIGLTTKEFSDSIEVDSSKRAIIYSSSPSPTVDFKDYKKITVKSIKNKNVKRKVRRIYYIKKNSSYKTGVKYLGNKSVTVIYDSILPLPEDAEGRIKPTVQKKFLKSINYPQSFLILRLNLGMTFWKMKVNDHSKVDDLNRNQYAQSNSNIAVSILFEHTLYKNMMIRSGLGFIKVNKAGSYISTKSNSYYPYVNIVEKNNYSQQYFYLSIPIGVSYKLGNNRSYMVLAGELQTNLFLNSDMSYYPIYQTQYFYDLNPLGTGNPYYTRSNEPITTDKTQFRSMLFSCSFKAESNLLITKTCSIFFAPEVAAFFGSIYKKNAPVKETPFILGISLGCRHTF